MDFPGRIQAQSRLEDSTRTSNEDRELLRSLNKLNLSTSPSNSSTSRLSTSPNSNAPKFPGARLSSGSPRTGTPPRTLAHRSSANGLNAQSRSATPTLLRKTSMNSLHSSSGVTPSRAPSRRGSSTHLLSPSGSRSPLNGSMQGMEEFKEKPAPTAASVASTYMQNELELLHGDEAEHHSETIVILNDACYGHRYSRQRATKADLASIVERPERIQASVLGLSMAYVRLGERHCDGKYPIHPRLDPKSLPNIPFRIHKTNRAVALDSAAVTNVHGNKWMEELKIMCDSAEAKLALNNNELQRPNTSKSQHGGSPKELHKGDLYLCAESLNAFEGALGAVCEAVDQVFSASSHNRAFVAVRPPGHHCSASYPSGFCWVNNVQVGIMHGFLNHGLTHAAIIDFDLHHGDGSQAIAWDHNKRSHTAAKNSSAWKRTAIGYFSLHDINSFPCEYGDEDKVRNASVCVDNAHGQSIWNIHLQEWKSDVEFWKLYQSKYTILLEKARCFLRTQTERYRGLGQVPKAAIFLSAGFDASEWESGGMQRHKVNVPTEFYARLTRDVVRIASEEGLGVDGRVISVLEGGYSDRALCSGVLSHLSGLAGNEPLLPKEETPSGLGYEMGNRIGSFSRRNTLTENEMKLKVPGFPYDPTWWSASELDRLDAAMTAPFEQPKKARTFTPGNYSSPTQASSAKAVDPTKVRRSVSGLASQMPISRPPSPPPPDVPWTAAAHELSKLLIPSHRQIDSCRVEELNAVAAKARRERQSLAQSSNSDETMPPPTAPGVRKSLRERKPVSYVDDDPKSRRRTVGGSTVLATEKALARGIPTQNGSTQHHGGVSLLTANDAVGGIPRPSTAQSIRPESSMSVRTQASTINVKKTRPAAPVRKESTRAPRKPRTVSSKTEGVSLPLKKEHSVGSSGESTGPASDPASELEKITNGMKKIKINVLTKEKKEARQKAEAERKAAEQQDLNQEMRAVGGAPVSIPLLENDPIVEAANGNESGAMLPPPPRTTQYNRGKSLSPRRDIRPFSPTNVPTILTPTEPNEMPFPANSPLRPRPEAEDIFVPYQPDGPTPSTLPISGPVQILEPNTDTPVQQGKTQFHAYGASSVPASPARRGGHGFTPTSNIPFAARRAPDSWLMSKDNVPAPKQKTEGADQGVWEIPETPQHH
ncbi:Arginase/deacetylase [Hypoxylon trugodes]|uniref:Arginase/deacetylase n=1 Tax=Hypoxylon trugodes TaxID=326681 RepID=UPI002199773E|nr:Arginase/deacetylase [Hypoxylon trugodes]KAI1386644.1 Arginase/deacetylase [Hypoxylon trugodes]